MILTARLIAAAIVVAVSPAAASPGRDTTAAAYRVSYEAGRDVYCIRFFSDAQMADPRPNVPGVTCRSRVAWEKQGVHIGDPPRDATRTAQH